MVFSSVPFLFAYLPAVLAGYYILRRFLGVKWRNAFLFFVSLVFYAWGEPVYVLLMMFSIAFGWLCGVLLERHRGDRQKALLILIPGIIVNIAILGFFKYANFFIHNTNKIFGAGVSELKLTLPVGVSFYTFQILSYIIDVYRGDAVTQQDILSFGAYISMFPQLVAGPIIRYNSIASQLSDRRESLDLFGEGAGLFVVGLCKKVLIANNIGIFWDRLRELPPDKLTVLGAWSGIIGFGLQLYFDFSGYSDMAVGLGRMLGFHFERNFDYPYTSLSVTEFWRRWHISLGAWFREYLYIPLGGSRRGDRRTAINLFVVWAATGLWHGANWNFIFWGLYYFVFLAGERFIWAGALRKAPKILKRVYVLAIVMAGWALFSFEDTISLGRYCLALVGVAGGGIVNDPILYYLSSWGGILLVAAVGATPLAASAMSYIENKPRGAAIYIKTLLMLAGFILSIAYLVDSSYNPFLYFKF